MGERQERDKENWNKKKKKKKKKKQSTNYCPAFRRLRVPYLRTPPSEVGDAGPRGSLGTRNHVIRLQPSNYPWPSSLNSRTKTSCYLPTIAKGGLVWEHRVACLHLR